MKRTFLSLAVILRLLAIVPMVTSALWYDENYTLLVLRSTNWHAFITTIMGDVHPPLFYMLEWPFGWLATHLAAPWMIRVLSMIFSIISLFVFWELLEKIDLIQNVRVAAFTVMAISSDILYYSTEGRMYALLVLLVMLGALALITRRWVWLSVITAMMIWIHNYGIIYAVCLWMGGMVFSPRDWKRLTLSIGAAGLSFLPWVFVLFQQMHTITGNYWLMDKITLPVALYALYQGFFYQNPAGGAVDNWSQAVFFGWLVFAILWIVRYRKEFSWTGGYTGILFVLAFGPFLLAVIGSLAWQPILLSRALVPSVPFLSVLLVMPLWDVWTGTSNFTRTAFLVGLVLISPILIINALRIYYPGLIRFYDDQKVIAVARLIEANWKPGDAILHVGDGTWIDIMPYTTHPEAQYKTASCGIVRGALSPLTRQGLGEKVVTDLPGKRVWFLTEESPMTPECEHAYIAKMTSGLEPITCFRDDQLKKNCLYLVKP